MASLKKAYFGMQCFWGVESSFAKLDGVLKTRVGYAGGTMPNPNYSHIGDHTEITEIQFDDSKVGYQKLLDWFWTHHDPTVQHKKQYASAILYTDEEQKRLAEDSKNKEQKKYSKKIETYIQPFDKFYQAEDYHQKYWLRCQNRLYKELNLTDEELVDSVLAAKMNAYLAGYNDFEVLKKLKEEYKLSEDLVKVVESIARAGGDPRSCH